MACRSEVGPIGPVGPVLVVSSAWISCSLKVVLSNSDSREGTEGGGSWDVQLEVWRSEPEEGGWDGTESGGDAPRLGRLSSEGWAVCGSELG